MFHFYLFSSVWNPSVLRGTRHTRNVPSSVERPTGQTCPFPSATRRRDRGGKGNATTVGAEARGRSASGLR